MTLHIDQLPNDIVALKQMLIAKQSVIDQGALTAAQNASHLLYLQTFIDKLKFEIARYKQLKFGASSEKYAAYGQQLELTMEDLQIEQSVLTTQMATPVMDSDANANELADASDNEDETLKRKHPRKLLPAHLPRETVIHAAPCACPACGGTQMRRVGEDVSEQLEFIPSHFKVIAHVRPKLSCAACQTMVQAPAPTRPLAKSPVGPNLLAHVMVSKYVDHLPLYRQSAIYARQDVQIERSTMTDWVGAGTALIDPLLVALRKYVLAGPKIHGDDTPVNVLQPGRKTTKLGRLWAYVRDDRNSGDLAAPAVWFNYTPDRKGEHPRRHLEHYKGILQADAFSGYDKIYESGAIVEAACWAHARRKFVEVEKHGQSPVALEAIRRIQQLYVIEARIRGKTAHERWQARQAESLPILKAMQPWLESMRMQTSKHLPLGKAINYSLNQWAALNAYISNGIIEIDNNAVEREIRAVALGRKNWLFAGSDSGGERAAAMYSLLNTAKLNGLNPQAYMGYVLANINDHKINKIDQLLPWNVANKIVSPKAQYIAQVEDALN